MGALFGLIGKTLGHSFSKKYFTDKFEEERLSDHRYALFELSDINQFPELIRNNPDLKGLNVTIPYKEEVIPHLDELADSARRVGAVNVIQFKNQKLIGHNSDYYGFEVSLKNWWIPEPGKEALVLGTGGASKAVQAVLSTMKVDFQVVSRSAGEGVITYNDLLNSEIWAEQYALIVNTTPVGMTPNTEQCPSISYKQLNKSHYLYDLVYNPQITLFMKNGRSQGSRVKNGLEMLHLQAQRSWEIWNS